MIADHPITNLVAGSAQLAADCDSRGAPAVARARRCAGVRYAYWRAIVALLCLALPWIQSVQAGRRAGRRRFADETVATSPQP